MIRKKNRMTIMTEWLKWSYFSKKSTRYKYGYGSHMSSCGHWLHHEKNLKFSQLQMAVLFEKVSLCAGTLCEGFFIIYLNASESWVQWVDDWYFRFPRTENLVACFFEMLDDQWDLRLIWGKQVTIFRYSLDKISFFLIFRFFSLLERQTESQNFKRKLGIVSGWGSRCVIWRSLRHWGGGAKVSTFL